MLDFRQRSRGRVVRTRGTHRRLVAAIFLLGLTVIFIEWAARPHNWRWFGGASGNEQADATGRDKAPDNRLIALAGDDTPDTLISPMPMPRPHDEPPVGSDRQLFPGVMANYFEPIRDDTPFGGDDHDAWSNLLDVLNRTDAKQLEDYAADRKATYAQLFWQPKQYRGQLVTVHGVVRRVEHLKSVPKNNAGIESYYRICVFPKDNPSMPVVVMCLELPQGFPVGMKVEEQVELAGFFFKRWAHLSPDTIRVSPTLLAKTLRWQRRPVMPREAEPVDTWGLALGIGGALLLTVVLISYVYFRTHRRVKP